MNTQKNIKRRTLYQAGYVCGGDWSVCGYGYTKELAARNLNLRIAEQKVSPETLKFSRYLERLSEEIAGTAYWDTCEDCNSEFKRYGGGCLCDSTETL
jgi:hypothetical protein